MSAPAPSRQAGRPLARREDELILRGRTRYLDDIEPAGCLHVAFVRSPFAHARIGGIQAPTAAPGLVSVLTSAELDARVSPLPAMCPEGATIADEPHPVLPSSEVRYAGQAVAAVVADSRALAEDAAELVEVEYEPLDAFLDPHGATELMRWERSNGDVEGALAEAHAVVAASYSIPRLAAAPIETRGAVASYESGADVLTVWCSAQDTHRPLAQLSHVLAREPESIHMIVPDVGGAFGSKGSLPPEAAVVAAAAMQLGRPVKWAEDRLENFLAGYQGRGIEADVELALADDGRMLALRARIVADLGGYLLPTTAIPPHTMAMLMTGCYAIPAAHVQVVGGLTHKVPTGPYRGAGRPEAAYALELTVDAAARELGMDPIELRRRNLIREFPHQTPLGFSYDSGDYERCLDRALELARPETRASPETLVGSGVALYVERSGGQWESARASVELDGSVLIRSSSSPHGQGHDTAFAQVAAERLGIEIGQVQLRFGDSREVPPGVGTFGSRSMAMGGSAVARAVDELRAGCMRAAARVLGAGEDEVEWSAGVLSANGRRLTLAELATAVGEPLEASARFSSDVGFSSGAYAAVVEIERASGRLRVLRLAAVDDAGTIVNPLLAEGQVLGGSVQGLGASLVEEVIHDDAGQPLTASFAGYSLLTAAEVPPIATAFVESPSPLNPLGAKGIGEGGAIGVPAAIGNAVADALGGKRADPPFTASKLWRAAAQ
jgi:carbon-monoxide dehydrogenase large subunit